MARIRWNGGSYRRGRVGRLNGRPLRWARPGAPLVLRCLGTVAVIALVFAAVAGSGWPLTLRTVAVTTVLLAAYSLLGYLVRPDPDMRNVGYHPFRVSDDANRLLLLGGILLFPGKLVAGTVVDLLLLLAARR